MSRDWLDSREVADLLGTTLRTLKNWRSDAYEKSPLRLVGEVYRHNRYHYPKEAVRAFLLRNPHYMDRVTAAFAPDEVRASLLPRSRATHTANELRRSEPLPPNPVGLAACIPDHYSHSQG